MGGYSPRLSQNADYDLLLPFAEKTYSSLPNKMRRKIMTGRVYVLIGIYVKEESCVYGRGSMKLDYPICSAATFGHGL